MKKLTSNAVSQLIHLVVQPKLVVHTVVAILQCTITVPTGLQHRHPIDSSQSSRTLKPGFLR